MLRAKTNFSPRTLAKIDKLSRLTEDRVITTRASQGCHKTCRGDRVPPPLLSVKET